MRASGQRGAGATAEVRRSDSGGGLPGTTPPLDLAALQGRRAFLRLGGRWHRERSTSACHVARRPRPPPAEQGELRPLPLKSWALRLNNQEKLSAECSEVAYLKDSLVETQPWLSSSNAALAPAVKGSISMPA